MKRWGILWQPGALWIGAHYSSADRRWCINALPMVTLWITLKGGRPPKAAVEAATARAWAKTRHDFAATFSACQARLQSMPECEAACAWRQECESVAAAHRSDSKFL